MACLTNDPVNFSNFLRWHRANAMRLPYVGCLPLCNDTLFYTAIPYDFGRDDYEATLPMVNGDVLRFFFNSTTPLDFNGRTLAVGLIYRGQRVPGGFTQSVTKIDYPLGGGLLAQRFYGELAVINLVDGIYTMYLYDTADPNEVLYLTNPLEVVNYSKWQRETCVAKFRHQNVFAGVDYPECPADFYQQFRIPFSLFQPTYPETQDDYTDRNGATRTTAQTIKLVYSLGSDLITQADFEAAVLMLAHGTHGELFIDGQPMKQTSALEVVDYLDDINTLTVRGKVEALNFARILSPC